MTRKVARWSGVLLLAALAFGVPGAGGKALTATTVIVQVIGKGTISGGGGQINCGDGSKSCYATYVSELNVTLTASAPTGWSFSSWAGSADCTGSSNTCTVPLNGGTHEQIAQFVPSLSVGESTLTVTEPTGGGVAGGDIDCGTDNSDCDTSVTTGSTLTLVETPDNGFSFGGWGGACSGTAVYCTITMSADRSVSATFTQSAATHTLSVSVTGNGTITGGGIACTSTGGPGCSASVAADSEVTLTAIPGSGASLTAWGGACAGTSTTCTIAMSADKSVTAAFSDGSGTSVPLAVSVSGNGKVTGGGIDCGSGSTACSVNVTTGSSVTLTATPASGATFTGWGGACSGATTCTVTMDAAKAISATFKSEAPPGRNVNLTLDVTGSGTVTAPGGRCASSSGTKTCTQPYPPGAEVTLSAAAGSQARFVGWNGACGGTKTTCTVVLDAAKTVTATFTTPSRGTGNAALRSRGRPIVEAGRTGFAVTLRLTTSQLGVARVRAFRAGRIRAAFSFPVAAGPVTIGPFVIASPGYYTFEVAVGPRSVAWTACLGRCGADAAAPRFTLTRRAATAINAGAAWSVTIRFQTTLPAAVQLRMYRGGALALDYRFAPPAGGHSAGPFLVSPGGYTVRLTATDAYGRVRTLAWFAFLP